MPPKEHSLQHAPARVLAVIVAADGRITDNELGTLERLRAFHRLGISRDDFVDLAQGCVDDVGHGGAATFTHAQGMAEARGWREAFPDLNITVDTQVAENDLVAVRWTARGTNTGSGNGIPATGRTVQINGTTLFRLDDGKIAEEWTCANSLGLMRQLGLDTDAAALPKIGRASCRERVSSPV